MLMERFLNDHGHSDDAGIFFADGAAATGTDAVASTTAAAALDCTVTMETSRHDS